jgi:hypothetical protein
MPRKDSPSIAPLDNPPDACSSAGFSKTIPSPEQLEHDSLGFVLVFLNVALAFSPVPLQAIHIFRFFLLVVIHTSSLKIN